MNKNRGSIEVLLFVIICLIVLPILLWSLGAFGVIGRETAPGVILQKYEWFKKQCTDINAMEKNIQSTKVRIDTFKKDNGAMKTWDWNMKDEYSRISTVLQGQIQQYNSLVAEYNQRASMINWSWAEGKYPREFKEYQ